MNKLAWKLIRVYSKFQPMKMYSNYCVPPSYYDINEEEVNKMHLKGKVSLIVGSPEICGLAIAKQLAAQGSYIVLSDSDRGKIERALNCLHINQAASNGIVCNTKLMEDRKFLFKQVEKDCGGIDILVYVAPDFGSSVKYLTNCPQQVWDDLFEANLRQPFSLVSEGLKYLKASSGTIVFLLSCSINGQKPHPGAMEIIEYSMRGFVKKLSEECERYKINVNAISPGALKNKFLDAVSYPVDRFNHQLQNQLVSTENCDVVDPDDIGKLVCLLGSKCGYFINGEFIGYINQGLFDEKQDEQDNGNVYMLPNEEYGCTQRIKENPKHFNEFIRIKNCCKMFPFINQYYRTTR